MLQPIFELQKEPLSMQNAKYSNARCSRDTFLDNNSVKMALFPFWKGIFPKRKEFAPLGLSVWEADMKSQNVINEPH